MSKTRASASSRVPNTEKQMKARGRMHDELLLCSWRLTMSDEGALSVRYREPKTFCEEEELVEKAVPSSTKYKNKWALSVFGEWQFARTIKVPVLDPGGLFKDYDLHKVATVSTDIEEMDALSLNYWFSKFVMEVAKKTGELLLTTGIALFP